MQKSFCCRSLLRIDKRATQVSFPAWKLREQLNCRPLLLVLRHLHYIPLDKLTATNLILQARSAAPQLHHPGQPIRLLQLPIHLLQARSTFTAFSCCSRAMPLSHGAAAMLLSHRCAERACCTEARVHLEEGDVVVCVGGAAEGDRVERALLLGAHVALEVQQRARVRAALRGRRRQQLHVDAVQQARHALGGAARARLGGRQRSSGAPPAPAFAGGCRRLCRFMFMLSASLLRAMSALSSRRTVRMAGLSDLGDYSGSVELHLHP